MIKDNMDNTKCYIDTDTINEAKFYSTYCYHGFNPKENCHKCCKYCGIPFHVSQIDEDEFEISCNNCGYDVS